MSRKKALSLRILGRVQGVGYRWFAQRAARELGLTGTVRNLHDGAVEVIAEGDEELLLEFVQELWRGPPAGIVQEIEENWGVPSGDHSSFRITF